MNQYDEYDTLITALDEALRQQASAHESERTWTHLRQTIEVRVTLATSPGTDRISRARYLAALWLDDDWDNADVKCVQAWHAARDADRTVEILRDRISALRLRLQHRS